MRVLYVAKSSSTAAAADLPRWGFGLKECEQERMRNGIHYRPRRCKSRRGSRAPSTMTLRKMRRGRNGWRRVRAIICGMRANVQGAKNLSPLMTTQRWSTADGTKGKVTKVQGGGGFAALTTIMKLIIAVDRTVIPNQYCGPGEIVQFHRNA